MSKLNKKNFQCCFFINENEQCKNKAVHTMYSGKDPKPIYDKYTYACHKHMKEHRTPDDIIQDINLPV